MRKLLLSLLLAFSFAGNAHAADIILSGVLESEASFVFGDNESQDIVQSTVELDINTLINPYLKGSLVYLWEEGEGDFVSIDQAHITIGGFQDMSYYVKAGKLFPRFGNYYTSFISDPLTHSIGEINQSAVEAGLMAEWIWFSLCAYNGDVTDINDDTINGLVATISLSTPQSSLADLKFSTGLSYINNIADTDGLQSSIATAGTVDNNVGGFNAYFVANYEQYAIGLEYITSTGSFSEGDFDFDEDGVPDSSSYSPSAYAIELSTHPIPRLMTSIRLDGSSGVNGYQPDIRAGIGTSLVIYEGVTLSGEYTTSEGRSTAGIQLAYTF